MTDEVTIEPGDLLIRAWPPHTLPAYGWQRDKKIVFKLADGTEQWVEGIKVWKRLLASQPQSASK